MTLFDLFRMGLKNLTRRKARTALTVLGVIIGTVSIVSMVSIGIGINTTFDKQYMTNGSMTIIQIQQYGSIIDDDGNWLGEKEQVLDDTLVASLRGIDHIKAICPVINTQLSMKCGKYESNCQLRAIGRDSFYEFGYPETEIGSYPTADNYRKLVFSNYSIQEFYYWSTRNYETKTVDLTQDSITVTFPSYMYQRNERKKEFQIKVTPKSENWALMSESDNWEYNYYCYVDMDYFREMWTEYCKTLTVQDRKKAILELESYDCIYVNVDNINNVSTVQDEIEKLGYVTYSDSQYLEPLKETSNMIQLVLGAIGCLAMLVSAINIANTMVMSIYERTREIGIMKVLGCYLRDIRKLFLYEAALIGLLGGVIGIVISYIVSALINKYGGPIFAALMQTSGVYDIEGAKFSVIPWWLPFGAAAFGMVVGILAGYVPARKATKISAIEAMKTNS